MLDGEGATVFERERLDHRESLFGQPPISEQRGEYGLRHARSCPWIEVIELARQLIPAHARLHGWVAFQIGPSPRPRKQVSMSAPYRIRVCALWPQDTFPSRLTAPLVRLRTF